MGTPLGARYVVPAMKPQPRPAVPVLRRRVGVPSSDLAVYLLCALLPLQVVQTSMLVGFLSAL